MDITYTFRSSDVVRSVLKNDLTRTSKIDATGFQDRSPEEAWFLAQNLGRPVTACENYEQQPINVVDLFSGSGGFSVGIHLAAEALGLRAETKLAVDLDPDALEVYRRNHQPRRTYRGSVRDLLVAEPLLNAEDKQGLKRSAVVDASQSWLESVGDADLLVGGPPCQGHSNLNNVTRRVDERNQLYFWMALAAKAFTAKAIVIENVASVKADAGDVVGMTLTTLGKMGYTVLLDKILDASHLGVAQTRKRHFLIAVRNDILAPNAAMAMAWLATKQMPTLSVLDVIGDLEDLTADDPYNRVSELSEENRARIDHLFDSDTYNLPDHVRPKSHRQGNTYPSVYGRMRPDKPAGTLSTGFLTPGRGRYIHPTRRRTLTLHEGARVQGYPDTFSFTPLSGKRPSRTAIARMIGDAVPPPLAFHVTIATFAAMDLSPKVKNT